MIMFLGGRSIDVEYGINESKPCIDRSWNSNGIPRLFLNSFISFLIYMCNYPYSTLLALFSSI